MEAKKDTKGEELYNEAIDLAFKHEQQKALEKIENALTQEPKNAKYAVEKAEIMCELGKMTEAVTFLEISGKNYEPHSEIEKEIKKLNEELAYDKITPSDAKGKQKLAALLKWGYENGIDSSNMKVVYYGPDFRGVHAARRIRKGDIIVSIPEGVLLTIDKIKNDFPLAKKVAECGIKTELLFGVCVAIAVLKSKNDPKSWYHPYADTFPEDVSSFPFFFTKEESEYLKGTQIEKMTAKEMAEMKDEYENFAKAVPEFREIPFNDYMRLTTIADSRYFKVRDATLSSAAAPIVDMFNFYIDKMWQAHWEYNKERKAFIVEATEDIQRGEVIGLNYGFKSNQQFLLHYGFIPENNTFSSMKFDTYLNPKDPLLKEKQRILQLKNEELKIATRYFATEFFNWFKKNDKAISQFRLAVYSGDIKELEKSISIHRNPENGKIWGVRIPLISVENETKALELLKESALEKLKHYTSTTEKDEEILKTKEKTLTMNMKNALKVRISEKKYLHDIMDFVDTMIKFMKQSKADAEKQIEEMSEDLFYIHYAEHITNNLLK